MNPLWFLVGGLLALVFSDDKKGEPEPKVEEVEPPAPPPAPPAERIIERIYVAPEPRRRRKRRKPVVAEVVPPQPEPEPIVEPDAVEQPA